MSYEPTIIVEQKDLEKLREQIYSIKYEELQIYLEEVLSYEPTKFKGLKLVLFCHEFSSFNAKVRKYLEDNEIEYALDD